MEEAREVAINDFQNNLGTPPTNDFVNETVAEKLGDTDPGTQGALTSPDSPTQGLPVKFLGKKVFIQTTNTLATTEDPNLGAGAVSESDVDLFRRETANFWTIGTSLGDPQGSTIFRLSSVPQIEYTEAKQKVYKMYSPTLNSYIYLQKQGEQPIAPDTNDGTPPPAGFDYLGKRENYIVYLKPEDAAKIKINVVGVNWGDYLTQNFGGGKTYGDHNFVMETPNDDTKFDYGKAGTGQIGTLSEIQNAFVHVQTNYNYLEQTYEEALEDEIYNEKMLPHVYSYMAFAEHQSKILDSNKEVDPSGAEINNIFNHVTLNERLLGYAPQNNNSAMTDAEWEKKQAASQKEKKKKLKKLPIGMYFDKWTASLSELSMEEMSEITDNYNKMIFSEMNYEFIAKNKAAAMNFPMNVNLRMSSDPNKIFFNIVKKTKNNGPLLSYLSTAPPSEAISFISSDGATTDTSTPRATWDFEAFLKDMLEGNANTFTAPDDAIFFGDITGARSPSSTKNIFNQLYSLALKAKVDEMVKSNFRSYKNLLMGQLAYSETFFYEIEKWSSNEEGTPIDLIQRFFVPNDDKKVLDFFDTQVKYATFYVYKIYTHKIVLGSEYTYELGTGSEDGGWSNLTVTTTPSIKIIKVPYYNVKEQGTIFVVEASGEISIATPIPTSDGEATISSPHKTTIVMDDPPLPPEIEFLPIINKPHDVILNIKDTLGSSYEFAKKIGDLDSTQASIILKTQMANKFSLTLKQEQNLDINKNKIFYKSDEPSESYEIFQTSVYPSSYEDLEGKTIAHLPGPNTSTILTLPFNKKNYFAARAVDFHGKYSNPTHIYEVELKENSGAVYPVIRAIDIEEENKKIIEESFDTVSNKTLSGKRFVLIKPSHQQISLDPSLSDDFDSAFELSSVELGDSAESIFQKNRKFKIRVTSKKTGRVIDINLNYNHKHDKILVK